MYMYISTFFIFPNALTTTKIVQLQYLLRTQSVLGRYFKTKKIQTCFSLHALVEKNFQYHYCLLYGKE